jgi:hypothetical protein
MKIRDSGMPEEAYWESLFDVPLILSKLGIGRFGDVVELGCGYGTFSIPVAGRFGASFTLSTLIPQWLPRTVEGRNPADSLVAR